MSKLSRTRKREIREAVRNAVACEIRNMDDKNFENIAETEEETAYVLSFRSDLADSIDFKKADVGVGADGE